jgi:hypothetical protein
MYPNTALLQILYLWTLSIILFLPKIPPFIFQNITFWRLDSVSVFRLKPTQLGPINRASPYLLTMDNVHKHNVTNMTIAKQRLSKHLPAQARDNNRVSIARQCIGRHAWLK